MGLGNLNPGCKCCCPTYFSDTFSAGDTTTPPGWDERLGDWSISSGALTVPSGVTEALIVATADAGDATHTIEVQVKTDTSGDRLRGVVAYVDDENYLFADVAINSSFISLRLYQRSAGINTELGSARSVSGSGLLGQFHTLKVCYEAGTYPAQGVLSAEIITAAGNKQWRSYSADSSGTKAGLGTGSISGTIAFDNFKLQDHVSEDDSCPFCRRNCSVCDHGTDIERIDAELEGMTHPSDPSSCCNFNATANLLRETDCTWTSVDFLACYSSWTLTISRLSDTEVRVNLSDGSNQFSANATITHAAGSFDCFSELDGLVMTNVTAGGFGCDDSAATVTLTCHRTEA